MKRIMLVCGLDKRIKTAPLCEHKRTVTKMTRINQGGYFVIIQVKVCLDCGAALKEEKC